MIKIYLDVCCLNRPFDDQTKTRIRLEAEGVLAILSRCEAGKWEWIGSDTLSLEIARTPDPERRRRVQVLSLCVTRCVRVGAGEVARAQELQSWGFFAFDALHLACAEAGKADVFLTTDDDLLRKAHALGKRLRVRIENPLSWLREVGDDE